MILQLKDKLKALALLDAIIEPEWEYRYFSYDSKWGESEEMASMRDGQGGQWFVLFQGDRIGYKCISPEDGTIEDLPAIKAQLPAEYDEFINEPAFYVDHATAIWVLVNNEWVKYGKEIKWIIDLPTVLNWQASDYQKWAKEYYEREFDFGSIEEVFKLKVTGDTITKLNDEATVTSLTKDIDEIGIQVTK